MIFETVHRSSYRPELGVPFDGAKPALKTREKAVLRVDRELLGLKGALLSLRLSLRRGLTAEGLGSKASPRHLFRLAFDKLRP